MEFAALSNSGHSSVWRALWPFACHDEQHVRVSQTRRSGTGRGDSKISASAEAGQGKNVENVVVLHNPAAGSAVRTVAGAVVGGVGGDESAVLRKPECPEHCGNCDFSNIQLPSRR
jgi:hypothetical protein